MYGFVISAFRFVNLCLPYIVLLSFVGIPLSVFMYVLFSWRNDSYNFNLEMCCNKGSGFLLLYYRAHGFLNFLLLYLL